MAPTPNYKLTPSEIGALHSPVAWKNRSAAENTARTLEASSGKIFFPGTTQNVADAHCVSHSRAHADG
jgi:hypothetical protein